MANWHSLSLHPLLLFLLLLDLHIGLLSVASSRGPEGNRKVPSPSYATETAINNVVQDPGSGRIYLGAVNAIFQLGPALELQARAETGPKEDSHSCTPPPSACQGTSLMPNLNKLLLVNAPNGSLIVCGSRYKGICSLLNLTNVEQQMYYTDSKGERTYVASIEDNVNVVGVMSTYRHKDTDAEFSVFLVGKGFGSQDSTKLISTRILEDWHDWVVFESIVEASAVQTAPFAPKHQHDFRHAFKEDGFVYFLFSRTLDGTDTKNLTYVSRLCESDFNYYSYTELLLNCGPGNRYSKVQAAFVASPGKELALSLAAKYGKVFTWNKVLFMVASPPDDDAATTDSALCMYPLSAINEGLLDIITACYFDLGKIGGKPAVDIPYSSKADEFCKSQIAKDTLETNKCGADFLPSPLASKPDFALKGQYMEVRKGLLTAVAIVTENDHTIAFLGNNQGEVHKAHLSAEPDVFGKIPGDTPGERVNKNLFFDLSQDHLYITTEKKITKVPVQTCSLKTDCQSCVALKDPYCGWCVLEGRCTRRSECRRAEEKNGWLWSPRQQCVKILSFSPPNLSCHKTQQVEINIPSLPTITASDRLCCVFHDFRSEGSMSETGQVTCTLPDPAHIPHTPEDQDFVAVPVKIFVNETVELATREFKFYNCSAAVRNAENTPCMSCVASPWGCQWNTKDYTCSDMDDTIMGSNIIKQRQGQRCPRFENPDPVLIPVGYETIISFEGINLEQYHGRAFMVATELMRNREEVVMYGQGPFYNFNGFDFSYDKSQETTVVFYVKDKETGKKIDSTLNVTLYNCSMGRKDCSLCKNSDPKYSCVWCNRTKSCIYTRLCRQEDIDIDCPDPQITNIIPRFGPLYGGISITILGSNLGIHKADIKSITVAGEPCVHLQDKYSVSTSLVCEIGPLTSGKAQSGKVEVVVEGGKRGTSTINFTYREPHPQSVSPSRGPKAGGTLITITGKDLDTGTMADVHVTVGAVVCVVEKFKPLEIFCRTGVYVEDKVPSDQLPVKLWYGQSTTVSVPGAFQFLENPILVDHHPKSSFDWFVSGYFGSVVLAATLIESGII